MATRAIRNPELIRQGLKHLREHGLRRTLDVAGGGTAPDSPLGYSCAGTVVAAGQGVVDLHVGDAVACAGAGYANHAELIFVPRNLVAKIPMSMVSSNRTDRSGHHRTYASNCEGSSIPF